MTQAVQNPMAGWEPNLHPRDSHGRFRDKWGISEAGKKLIQGILKHWNSPTFKSDEHAAAYAQQLAKKKKRSPEQQASIDYFMTKEGNADIQSTLRVGKDDLPQVRNLDEMMTPLPHDVILTRVLGPDAFGLPPERMGEVEEWTGKLIFDHGYAPTNLANPHEAPGPHITMSILAPHGTKAVVPGDGRAVILDREQPMRITKVQPDGHGGLFVYAVVAPKQGNKEPARALGKELAPGEVSPAIEATPEELAKRGLDPEGNPIPPGGMAPVAPAVAPAPGARPIPPGRDNLGAPPAPGPPEGVDAPVHQERAGVAQERIDQAKAAGREPAKEDVRKLEQEQKLADVAGTAPEPAPIEGPDQKPAFKDKNLEPGPEHPDKVKKREEARAAQQETAKAEAPAEAAVTVADLINKKASNSTIAQHLRAIAAGDKLDGIRDEGDRDAVREDLEAAARAFQDDNPMEGKKIIRSLARATGVEMQGDAGEKTKFDPAVHDAVNGDGLKAGDEVEVLRPGALMRRKNGDLVHLDRAMVRRVAPEGKPQVPDDKTRFGAPKIDRGQRLEALKAGREAKIPEGPPLPSAMARERAEVRKAEAKAAAAKKAAKKAGAPVARKAAAPKVFNEQDLDKNAIPQLRAHAKEKGIKLPAGARKADIIAAIKAGPKKKTPGTWTPERSDAFGLTLYKHDGDKGLVTAFDPDAKNPKPIFRGQRGNKGGVKDFDTLAEAQAWVDAYDNPDDPLSATPPRLGAPKSPAKKATPKVKAPEVRKANNVDDLRNIVADLQGRDAKHDEVVKELEKATAHLDDVQVAALRGRLLAHEQLNDRTITRALAEIIENRDKKNGPAGLDLNKMLVKDLRAEADKRGIKIPAGARKADIVRMLGGQGPSGMPADGLDVVSLAGLRNMGQGHGIPNANRMGKLRLIQELRRKGVAVPEVKQKERFPSFGTRVGAPEGNVKLRHEQFLHRSELVPGDEIEITRYDPDAKQPKREFRIVKSANGPDVELDDGSFLLSVEQPILLSRRKGVKPPAPEINRWAMHDMDKQQLVELAEAHGLPVAGRNRGDLHEALIARHDAIQAQRQIEDHDGDVAGAGALNNLQTAELLQLFDDSGMKIPFALKNRRDLIKEALRRKLTANPDEMNSSQLRNWLETRAIRVPKDATDEQMREMLKNPPVLQYHQDVPADVKKLIDHVASGIVKRNELGGGAMGETSKVETSSGGEAIEKIHHRAFDTPPRQQADAEQLASVMGQAIGARAPAVYRQDGKTIFMEHVTGKTAGASKWERVDEAYDRPEAKWIGLLDMLIGNNDRHDGNWMITPDGRPVPIDHGLGWSEDERQEGAAALFHSGPFAQRWREGKYHMTAGEKAEITAKLEALRPQFILLGRESWLDASLARLDHLDESGAVARLRRDAYDYPISRIEGRSPGDRTPSSASRAAEEALGRARS